MTARPEWLDALQEPAILVSPEYEIVNANRAFVRLVGRDPTGASLIGLVAQDTDQTELFLQRCFGSGQPVVGTIVLPGGDEPQKLRAKGNALNDTDGRLVLLRLSLQSERQFVALTQMIADLRSELEKRRRSEARLAETAREREMLLRELEHRVKNNMQMLSALLNGAERDATSPEAKAALSGASRRFAAVSAVQKLLYRSDDLGTIPAQDLIGTLASAASSLAEDGVKIDLDVQHVDLAIDASVSVGLILNELITNAVKYGRPESGTQTLFVKVTVIEDKVQILVQDNGPGYGQAETARRTSGLGLVRGLLRQLGGSLAIENKDGTLCRVTLPFSNVAASTACR